MPRYIGYLKEKGKYIGTKRGKFYDSNQGNSKVAGIRSAKNVRP